MFKIKIKKIKIKTSDIKPNIGDQYQTTDNYGYIVIYTVIKLMKTVFRAKGVYIKNNNTNTTHFYTSMRYGSWRSMMKRGELIKYESNVNT